MNDLQIFDFDDRSVRVLGTSDAPLFVAKDVAAAMGITDYNSVIRDFADDEKGMHTMHTLGGTQQVAVLTEPGLYRLTFSSRKPEAERFKRWVFHDILPAIRKAGGYVSPYATETQLADLTTELAERRLSLVERKKSLLQELGVYDDRDRLALADELRGTPGHTNPADQYITITSRATEMGHRLDRGEQIAAGKLAAKFYEASHGKPPEKHNQYVDGAVRNVNTYTAADKAVIDRAILQIVRPEF